MQAQTTRRLVLLPRFTTLVGAGTYYTKPVSIRPYGEAILSVWRGPDRGTSPTFNVVAQVSRDLASWANAQTFSPSSSTESTATFDVDAEWMRLRLVVGGTDPSVTSWCVGEFVERERR